MPREGLARQLGDGIWNWSENSTLENVGYSLGALGILSDLVEIYDYFQAAKNGSSGLSNQQLKVIHQKYSNTKLNKKILYDEGNYAGNSPPGINPEEFLKAGIPLKGNDGIGNIFGGFNHDLGYYNAGTDGVRGVLFNMTVKKADWSLARGMAKYIKQGGLTRQQLSAARRIRDVFTGVTIYKEVVINQYLLNIIK